MRNARAKIRFFTVKYANLWGFCCPRRRGCLSSLLGSNCLGCGFKRVVFLKGCRCLHFYFKGPRVKLLNSTRQIYTNDAQEFNPVPPGPSPNSRPVGRNSGWNPQAGLIQTSSVPTSVATAVPYGAKRAPGRKIEPGKRVSVFVLELSDSITDYIPREGWYLNFRTEVHADVVGDTKQLTCLALHFQDHRELLNLVVLFSLELFLFSQAVRFLFLLPHLSLI